MGFLRFGINGLKLKLPEIDENMAGLFWCGRLATPERQLMGGILTRSLWDLQHETTRKDAWRWFFSDRDSCYFLSFHRICEELSLPKVRIRKRILELINAGKFDESVNRVKRAGGPKGKESSGWEKEWKT